MKREQDNIITAVLSIRIVVRALEFNHWERSLHLWWSTWQCINHEEGVKNNLEREIHCHVLVLPLMEFWSHVGSFWSLQDLQFHVVVSLHTWHGSVLIKVINNALTFPKRCLTKNRLVWRFIIESGKGALLRPVYRGHIPYWYTSSQSSRGRCCSDRVSLKKCSTVKSG